MGGQRLDMYGLPTADTSARECMPLEYFLHVHYNQEEQAAFSVERQKQLTDDQCSIYTAFMSMVDCGQGGIVFVDAPGGTGKTFLMNLILSTVRSHGHIALATASSGIAATLLTGGRTFHSTFKIPLNVTRMDMPVCAVKRGTTLAKVITDCHAIIVDEAPMTHRLAFEAVDRTLRDITCNDLPMGGIATLFCGDFRQILPVIPRGTRANIVDASLRKSYLWQFIKVMHLHTNMRAHIQRDTSAGDFATLLLSIGDGAFPLAEAPDLITLPATIGKLTQSPEELIKTVYPNINTNARDTKWLGERAILAPLNSMVSSINSRMVHEFEGEIVKYTSIDSAMSEDEAVHFPVEFLNSIELSGLPPHNLYLKVGIPIIVLRSLDPPHVTNGTRCIITRLFPNVIQAELLHGPSMGKNILVPRIPLLPSDTTLPFTFRRLQFPIQPCFSMTINKAQGQTFRQVGVDLSTSCFTHGMLYVALSRVGSQNQLTVFSDCKTRNVVYKEALC